MAWPDDFDTIPAQPANQPLSDGHPDAHARVTTTVQLLQQSFGLGPVISVADLAGRIAALEQGGSGAAGGGVVLVPAPTGDPALDTANIQTAVQQVRAAGGYGIGTVQLQPGDYAVNASINCTGMGHPGGGGLTFAGAGFEATRIIATLPGAHPVIDFSGSTLAHVRDFWVLGAPGGSQTVGVRFARTPGNSGDHVFIQRVGCNGQFTIAGAAFLVDLFHAVDCSFTGPRAVVWLAGDNLGVGSAYTTLGSTSNTLATIDSCVMHPTGAGMGALYILGGSLINLLGNCYVNLEGQTRCAIEMASGDGCTVVAQNLRVENNGSTATTYVMYLNAGANTAGGELCGEWVINNGGAVVGAANYAASFNAYKIKPSTITSFSDGDFGNANGWPTWFDSNVSPSGCEIFGNNQLNVFGGFGGVAPLGNFLNMGLGDPMPFPAGGGGNHQISVRGLALTDNGHRLLMGPGVPDKPNWADPMAGDYYFRTDVPSLYVCTTGGASPAWTVITGAHVDANPPPFPVVGQLWVETT